MRAEYDFSGSRKNPYAKQLKRQVTIRLDAAAVKYFKEMAAELGIPYQNLINLFLRDCAMQKRRPTFIGSRARQRSRGRRSAGGNEVRPRETDGFARSSFRSIERALWRRRYKGLEWHRGETPSHRGTEASTRVSMRHARVRAPRWGYVKAAGTCA